MRPRSTPRTLCRLERSSRGCRTPRRRRRCNKGFEGRVALNSEPRIAGKVEPGVSYAEKAKAV